MLDLTDKQVENIIEAALLAAEDALNLERLHSLFIDPALPGSAISAESLQKALGSIQESCLDRGIELRQTASGYRLQVKAELSPWINRLWLEKPPRYSRALLETLALIAYQQPITRGEIEEVRGVSVSSQIMKNLLERSWVRVIGHRDVPGKPAIYATTRKFLDYFNLRTLEDLPALVELRDLDSIEASLLANGQLTPSSPPETKPEMAEKPPKGDME